MKIKSLSLNYKPSDVSVKKLTLPHGTLKVGVGVKSQHVFKVNYGKVAKLKQKSSAQLRAK